MSAKVELAVVNEDIQRAFIEKAGWGDAHCEPMPGDLSHRRYLRLTKGGQSRVVMIDEPPLGKLTQFCDVADLLSQHGFRVPFVAQKDERVGLALLEDFGCDSFTKMLAAGEDKRALYDMAIAVLIRLRQEFVQRPAGIADFTPDVYLNEIRIFTQWYYPAVMNKALDSSAEEELLHLVDRVWQKALAAQPHTLILKDFHVDNMMRVAGDSLVSQCGLIDFQDAVWGPAAYDVTSLLQDSRIHMEEPLAQALLDQYLAAFPEYDRSVFMETYHAVGVQRNIKNLGVFARGFKRAGKSRYLQFIPRLWENLLQNLAHPSLMEIRKWMDLHLPTEYRKIPS